MADTKDVGAPALNTPIASGNFDEKQPAVPVQDVSKAKPAEDDDEDEDIDALIEDLESHDGHGAFEEEEEEVNAATGRVVPEDMLQTDSRVGLTESEVVARRRKYGLNQMKEEKENLILKFLSYFIGPIQFVMEVCICFLFYSICTLQQLPFGALLNSPILPIPIPRFWQSAKDAQIVRNFFAKLRYEMTSIAIVQNSKQRFC